MVTRTTVKITTAITAVAVVFTTILAAGVDRQEKIQSIERIPASLMKITSGETFKLKSKGGQRILRVDAFDANQLSVNPLLGATELEISALKPGCTEMKITEENGDVEQLVWVIKEPQP